jgi:hypothetical protein
MIKWPAASILLACALFGAEPEDRYGGWIAHDLGATGRFRIVPWKGKAWLVTPEGHPLIVVGLGDAQAYVSDVVEWMRKAGFNTFSYGVPKGAEDAMNKLGELLLVPGFINGPQFPDLFDPTWRAEAVAKIERLVPAMSRDKRIIGYVLSNPLLFSPAMAPRQNFLMAVKALPAQAAGKRAYVDYLRRTYDSFPNYIAKRGAVPNCKSFSDLLAADLSASDTYDTLHPGDVEFYTKMWSDLTAFLTREIRKRDPKGLIFSYPFTRVVRWPDPWIEAMLRGVGPHVDGFAAELYSDNAYREIVDDIGRITEKPAVIPDGMRVREFTYAVEADDAAEAASYDRMFRSLLASPWFLGAAVCEYPDKLPGNPYYKRPALLETFIKLHAQKYELKSASH